jgi:hypothetical protein
MHGNSGTNSSPLVSCLLITHCHRAYNVVSGLFQAPYYAFSQTMMAELSPPGFDNMVCFVLCRLFVLFPSNLDDRHCSSSDFLVSPTALRPWSGLTSSR